MYALLWVLWLCQGGAAAKQTVEDKEASPVPLLACVDLMCVAVVVVVVVFGIAQYCRAGGSEKRDRAKTQTKNDTTIVTKQAEPLELACPDELEGHLQQAFSQMEKELVKHMTFLRSYKIKLLSRHRGCKAPKCQQAKVLTERANNARPARRRCPPPACALQGCFFLRNALKTVAQQEEDVVNLLYKLQRLKVALANGWLEEKAGGDLVLYKVVETI